MAVMCGGFSAPRDASDEEKTLISSVRSAVEEKAGGKFDVFEVVSVSSQVVAGTRYKAKINVGAGGFAHVWLFRPLPCNGGDICLEKAVFDKKKQESSHVTS
ncbi:hypothetical protein DIPPA_02823 [Diplonema papillatum]|nr:hypothetical protein DIPPA_02823 [Diplonema papillatum]KAJ9460365.1 hypothetical protein DIPPA_02823 [Diplonema papillatum]